VKRKITLLVIVSVLVAIVIGGGYGYYSQNPAVLSQLQVQLGWLSQAEASGLRSVSGYIEAEEVNVAAETSGRISQITVDEGDFVEAGQVLVELDVALLEADVRQAEAKIATAKAQLAKIKAGFRAEEIGKAEAAVVVAEANADATYSRWQDTITLRDNPQELDMQIDAARTALELAELEIEYAVPLKDSGEALWELGKQQWDYTQRSHRGCGTNPLTGEKVCQTFRFKEGARQDAGIAWNYAGTDMWAAWVNLNSAVAERDDAETSLNDLLRLRNDPQEAQIKVTQAEAAYNTAWVGVEVAKARLEILNAGPRAEQITVAEAQVQHAEAALVALNVQRDKHTLVAPTRGWTVERVAHEGEMAMPSVTLLTLADLTKVTLTVYVPEPDIDTVSNGQKVTVFVDTFPDRPFSGYITYVSDEAEFTPKNIQTKEERVNMVFAVKIGLENEDQRLKPGMPADAILLDGPGF
jgi:multidrug efflux pump subunit AcrA (membrane-fusion protein)